MGTVCLHDSGLEVLDILLQRRSPLVTVNWFYYMQYMTIICTIYRLYWTLLYIASTKVQYCCEKWRQNVYGSLFIALEHTSYNILDEEPV